MRNVEYLLAIIAAAQVFKAMLSIVDYMERRTQMRRLADVQENASRALIGAENRLSDIGQDIGERLGHRYQQ